MNGTRIFTTVALCALLTSFAFAAETIHFREGGGAGYTDVLFDDTWMKISPSDDTTRGNDGYNGIKATSTSEVSLMAIKDLFTELPTTSGGCDIQINSATLHLFRYQGDASDTIKVYPMTTDWLPDDAGSNENDVTAEHAEKSADTHWSGGGDFSTSDYDSSVCSTDSWVNGYNEECELDITDVIADIYDSEVNYGICIRTPDDIQARASEYTQAYRPSLEIAYEYVGGTTYTLTVNSGTGDGSYAEDAIADIDADAAPSGQEFDEWVGDTSGIASVTSSSTTLTMPAANQEITATYTDKTWTLTVNSGTGDGSYVVATVVDITADTAPSGQDFDEWTGDVSGVADVNDPTTTLTMPYADAEVTATYTDKTWTLTVNSGTGDGSYVVAAVVDIDADAPASGKQFDAWTGDTNGVADVNDESTTLTMPYADAEITATYEDIPAGYALTVNSGSGDGSYAEDAIADIDADAAPSGQDFDEWVGDTSGIASVTSSSTTLTMPAANQEITATYTDKTWTLTVNSGTGDGSYVVATVVDITADTAPSGQDFDEWTGDVSGVADVNDPTTTVTMPYANAEVTATYTDKVWTLTVNSGTGDGSYVVAAVVDIDADAPASGKQFDQWMGDTAGIANVNNASTTLTMPYADAEITATYEDIPAGYALTVNSGSGDGSYSESQVVDISADTAASGKFFDAWTGDTANVADVNDPTTTITMPASDAEITATYADVASGLVSRFTFDIDGRDSYGTSDGTLTGGASVTNDGTRGKVVSLDGTDDYVSLPSSAMAAGRSELTLSMWINPDEWVTSNTIWDEYAETEYWQFTIREDGFITRDTSTGTTGSRDNDLPMPSVSTGSWHHLAFVYSASGDTKAIYLDGEENTSTSTSVDTLTSDRDGVGIGYACDGDHFDGMIDDVRLYDRALSSSEIALLAEQTEYTLTVNSGSGDGSYVEGYVVDISADAAPSGQQFDEWVGDTSGIANVNASSTTITMPASNAEITATYTDAGATYTLTVNSGTGDGNYSASTVVDITADSAPSGYVFDDWVGDTSNIADVDDPTTTITMPAADAEITATYNAATLYTLTVNSGSGDGSYQESYVVNISADSPPSGQQFDQWVGDTTGIANVNASSTTLTMPASNAEITATYEDIGGGPSVSSVSGSITQGSTITVSGSNFGTGPSGVVFDDFEGGTDGNDIMTGSGSATVGGWDLTSHSNYYTNDHSVSGNLAFEADMGVHYLNYVRRNFPAGTSEVFACWWVRIPDPMPGEGNPYEINWKHIWFQGSTAADDDLYFIYFHDLPSTIAHIGGNCGVTDGWMWSYGTWHKGDWIRGWIYVKGGITDGHFDVDMLHEDGNRGSWSVDGQTWGSTPTPYQYESVRFNAYGRQTTGSYPVHDDCYSAYGSNCRARVVIGNNSNYASCTDLAICGSTSWSSSSITAKCNIGGLGGGDWYLFVINGSNQKSTGYKVN